MHRLQEIPGMALALLALLALPTTVRADSQDTIDYRREIMSTMGQQVAAISEILQQKVPADSFVMHLQILATTATMAKKSFEPKVAGGESKPDVWNNWADFATRLDALSSSTAELARAGATGGTAAVAVKIQAALTCKSCHDNYRDQKPVQARAAVNDVVAYREHIMNTLNAQAEALGMILSLAVPNDNATAHLDVIALSAATALKAFEPRVAGGEAKPEVWSNWPDFSKRMNEFAGKTGALAKLAKDRGPEAALSNVLDALTCKSCHDTYRHETKD